MSIGVRFPEDPITPERIIRQLLDDFNGQRDARLRAILASGIGREQISVVAIAGCSECHGAGYALHFAERDGSTVTTLEECSLCPGICVDGQPLHLCTNRLV